MRWLFCAVVWAGSLLTAFLVASETRVGPVVIQLSYNHGVHMGDIAAFVVAIAFSSVVTGVSWVTRSRARPDSADSRDPSPVQ
jgi:hypothetical protein